MLGRWTKAALSALALAMLAPGLVSAEKIPTDPRLKTGQLDNGVKWIYRKHDNPPGKMSFMLHVDSGSLNETDAQQGLAHFLEHMCFNGTENFPPGELVPYFESIGMSFGQHLNAFTSFDQTSYMLFTPDTTESQVDKALMCLSDYAFRASLLKEEIDKERGVVLEEWRTGRGAAQRLRDKVWPELFEGTRFANRLPIGKEDIIETAPRSEFVDYYRTWYRPENITLVMVGDADPEPYLPMIEKWFGRYQPEVPTREQQGPEFKEFTEQRSIVATDPEQSVCSVQMLNILPGRPPTTTVAQARTELIEQIGSWIIGRRFDEMVNSGEASFRGAGASVMDFFHDAVLVYGSANGEPDEWNKMLEQLVMEINRARQFGFTEREFELAKTQLLSQAERRVKTEETINARSLVRMIASSVNEEEPFTSAQQDLDLLNRLFPEIQLKEVNKAFATNFEPGKFAYVVEMGEKEEISVPPEDEVLAAARAAWARKVEPPTDKEAATALLASLPEPGKVEQSHTDPDLGITDAWLSNGVRVHHRYMDYKKDEVMVSITLAGGQIEETEENAGITQVATLAVNNAATSRLDSTQIRDLMTGKNIRVMAGGGDDTFTVSLRGSPDDLEVGLQKAYALLTDGKIEEPAFDNWKKSTLQRIEMMEKMPQIRAFQALVDLLSGGDPRMIMLPTRAIVESQSVASAQKWYDRLCRELPIEVAIVGDIKLDDAMPLIERYIGSLPERPRKADHLAKLRKLPRSTGPYNKHLEVETMTPQAMGVAGFLSCDAHNKFERRAMALADNIMSSRMVKRIREDLSIVYSISARQSPDYTYEDSSTFSSGAPCDPENAKKLVEEIHTMFDEFAKKGPTEEELANAKKQILEDLDTNMREPNFWFGLLTAHDLHKQDYTETKNIREDYEKYTAEDVRKVFAKYNTPTRKFQVTAVPVAPETDKDAAKKEEAEPAQAPAS